MARKGKINFVTIEELVSWTKEWIKSFPESYDIILGIPRSGLLVASVIALKLAKPLSTPDLFLDHRFWKSNKITDRSNYKKVLLIDDSINSGKTMKQYIEMLKSKEKSICVTTGALIILEDRRDLIDLYYAAIPRPRIFEWNILHQKISSTLACSLEGIICEQCPSDVVHDESRYIHWISNAKPYLVPHYEIDAIISDRLEKYRSYTEKWLSKHNVLYKELLLWDTPAHPTERSDVVKFYINKILIKLPDLFFAGKDSEAESIWEQTNIPVFSFDSMILFGKK